MWASQDYVNHLGVRPYQTLGARTILQGMAERGFAHVPEPILLKLLDRYPGLVLPDEDLAGDYKMELVICAMSKVMPTWTDVDATKALNRCFAEENPNSDRCLPVSHDLISELVQQADAKDIKAFSDKLEKGVEVKKNYLASRRVRVHRYFTATECPAPKKGKTPRWLPLPSAMADEVHAWMGPYLPEETWVSVLLDQYNGRWRVINFDCQWRSISYTKRGFRSAAFEVLHQSWKYYEEATGLRAPFIIDELVSEMG